MSTRDLWDDIPDARQDSPDVILREQGERLAEKTDGEVRGYVPIRPIERGTEHAVHKTSGSVILRPRQGFTADLYFEVPTLNGYRHLFIEVELPLSMGYPVVLKDHINLEEHLCDTREEFEQKLEAAFKSPAVREIIAGLRTASRSMTQVWRGTLG
jgi:hypothetical protein